MTPDSPKSPNRELVEWEEDTLSGLEEVNLLEGLSAGELLARHANIPI